MSAIKAGRPAVRLLRSGQSCTLRSQITTTATPAPLFLDFLAPSWSQRQSSRLSTVSRNARTQSAIETARSPQRRCMSSTPTPRARITQNPRLDEDGKEMEIIITPRAAHRLTAIAEKDKNPDLILRVSVESGGCHGFQYLMKLVSKQDIDPSDDTVFVDDRQTGDGFKATVVMDEPSLELLKGSSIDYTMELIGSQFKVTGIPGATSSCGCGTSFDVAT